ncbi:MAG TPA: hypothetical protein VGM37_14265 [Armatimonadota bacterium]|jgi:hypothetical protein
MSRKNGYDSDPIPIAAALLVGMAVGGIVGSLFPALEIHLKGGMAFAAGLTTRVWLVRYRDRMDEEDGSTDGDRPKPAD